MGKSVKEESQAGYPVVKATVVDTVRTFEYIANIHSVRNIEIRSRIHGFVDEIFVDEGASVHEGQLIFRLSDLELREEVSKAEAQLKHTEAELEMEEVNLLNTKALVNNGVISEMELKLAKAKVNAAQATVEEMRSQLMGSKLKLRFTEIRAPFAGIIDRIPFKKGSLVDEGSLLTTLSDNSSVYAYFNVSEKEYLAHRKNREIESEKTRIRLVLADNTVYPHEGRIETLEGEFDKNTGTIAFRARFENPEKWLRHGASGKIRIQRIVDNVIVIPQKCTFEVQDRLYVMALDANNKVVKKRIRYSFRLPHLFVISEGLAPGERVIYEGFQSLNEGDVITPVEQDMGMLLKTLQQKI